MSVRSHNTRPSSAAQREACDRSERVQHELQQKTLQQLHVCVRTHSAEDSPQRLMKVSVCHQPNRLLAKALTTKPLSESLQVVFDPYERFKGQYQ